MVLGLFFASAWSPNWISTRQIGDHLPAPPLFRKAFAINGGIKSAVIKVVGLGDYVLSVNGHRVGDTVFNQPWSQYDKTIYFRSHEVANLLKPGENVFGAMLGNSFWNVDKPVDRYSKGDVYPRFDPTQQFLFAFECDITFRDGHHQVIKSDTTWKTHASPVTFSHIYGGEDYDARLAMLGWDKPGFNDTGWVSSVVGSAPPAKLVKQFWTGIRVKQTFSPVKVIKRAEDRWSFDFGQNCSGMVQIEVTGKAGETITMKPSEVMTKDGDVEQLNLGRQKALMKYTLSGGTTESWHPDFWYHGQQYVEVLGAVPVGQPNPLGLPVLKSIHLLHTRQDCRPIGSFQTSSDLYNRTYNLVDWAMRSNMSHVLTDCPHREKLGWLECSYLLAPTFSYQYDTQAWMEKILADMRDAQIPDGRILTTAPVYLRLGEGNPFAYTVEWGCAGVLLPWHMYEWYGDKQSLARSYASMRAFTAQITAVSPNHIAPGGLGDWYDYGHGKGPGESRYTPQDLSATATYAMCVETLSKSAKVLGNAEDAAKYEELWGQIRTEFLTKFYDAKTKTCVNHGSCQAGNSFALEANLIPTEDRAAVLDNIVKDLESRNYQQTPGDIGHVYFIRALAKAGRSDILHKVYSRTGVGSYGGILAKGLTAMPESWDAMTAGSNSLNHCMLGHINEWFYAYVLGIRQAEDTVGWKKIVIAPEPGKLSSASGSTMSPRGKIGCSWTNSDKGFSMVVIVPKGVAATIRLPKGAPLGCLVKGKKALTEGMTVFQVGEGTFHIEPYHKEMLFIDDDKDKDKDKDKDEKRRKKSKKDEDGDRD